MEQPGILELEAHKKLKKAIEAEKRAQKELIEAIYDILGLTEEERRRGDGGISTLEDLPPFDLHRPLQVYLRT